jgi:hypothetical protein
MNELEINISSNNIGVLIVSILSTVIIYYAYLVVGGKYLRKMGEVNCTKYYTSFFPSISLFFIVLDINNIVKIGQENSLYTFFFFFFIHGMFWSSIFTRNLRNYDHSNPMYGFFMSVSFPVIDILVMSIWLLLSINKERLILFRGPPSVADHPDHPPEGDAVSWSKTGKK